LKPTGYEVINLGSNHPVKLKYVIKLIEKNLGKKAKIKHLPRHPADVTATWAHIEKAKKLLDWKPKTSIEEGVEKTVRWFLENKEFLKKF
jgi:nucleoside-diphosphate-sugar epimerase